MSEESYIIQSSTFDNPTSSIINSTTFSDTESVVTESYIFTPPPKVKIVSTTHPVISRATSGSAGYDIRAIGDHYLYPDKTTVIPTGVHLDIPDGMFGMLVSRSGLAVNHGVTLANGVGIIDSDFHGEVRVAITNSGYDPFYIHDGDRVAQLLFMAVATPEFISVSNLSTSTTRNQSGFGSTGVE